MHNPNCQRPARRPTSVTGLLFLLLALVPATGNGEPERFAFQPLFQLQGAGESRFNQPTDVAVGGQGRICVLDGLNSRIAVFDSSGGHRFSFGSRGRAPGQLWLPVGLDVAPDGTVVVADTGNHRLQVFSEGGNFLRVIPLATGSLGDPTDVCVSKNGQIFYVCDNDNHQVQAYSSSGLLLWRSGERGERLGEFRYPGTLRLGPDGGLFVVDVLNARVQVLTPEGRAGREIGGWGNTPGRLVRPKGVAADNQGNVLVSDSQTGRISVFSLDGAFQGFVNDGSGLPVRFTSPTNLLVDQEGRLTVVETRANRVSVLKKVVH